MKENKKYANFIAINGTDYEIKEGFRYLLSYPSAYNSKKEGN